MTSRTAKVSKISYRLNVGRSDGSSIALGLLIHFKGNDGGAAIMLAALPKLGRDDLEKMDWGSQKILESPINYFKEQVDLVVADNSNDPLSALANKFAWSIHVAQPVEVPLTDQATAAFEAVLVEATKKLKSRTAHARTRPSSRVSRETFRQFVPEFSEDRAPEVLEPWMIGDRSSQEATHC